VEVIIDVDKFFSYQARVFRSPGAFYLNSIAISLLSLFAAIPATWGAQDIYVSSAGTVGEYDPITGSSVPGFSGPGGFIRTPAGLATSGSDLYVVGLTMGESLPVSSIGEYDATTGAAIPGFSPPGVNGPNGAATSGGGLYVANDSNNSVEEFNLSTGSPVSGFTSPSGLDGPEDLAISCGDIYISNYSDDTVGVYNASTGATINTSLISGLDAPTGLAISGSFLYVANSTSNTVGEYNAITGATINATLISGLDDPEGLAISGCNLYVANYQGNSVGEYNATTGATVNASLISLTPSQFCQSQELGRSSPAALACLGECAVSAVENARRRLAEPPGSLFPQMFDERICHRLIAFGCLRSSLHKGFNSEGSSGFE
jgi:hypothetical protein